MKVEELSTYGKTFDYMPTKAIFVQMRIMLTALIKKFGFFGSISFLRKVLKKQKRLKNKYSDILNERFPEVAVMSEAYIMGAIFLVLAKKEGREKAYEFLKMMIQKMSPTAHESFYCLKDLKKIEGDIFTNFCKLNRRLFENGKSKDLYDVEEIRDSEDLQYIRVTKCLNVEVMGTIDCSELAKLGCDGDIAGYAPNALGNKVNLDFRRPFTIAKGDNVCEFYYYRKGCAPEHMETK